MVVLSSGSGSGSGSNGTSASSCVVGVLASTSSIILYSILIILDNSTFIQ